MSITTLQRTINRTILTASLQGLRLPLTVVERVAHKDGDQPWPPALAFEAFEAEAKKLAGSLLRDEELVQQGRLQRAKVRELADAERLEAKAEAEREAAEARLEEKRAEAERQRQQAEAKAAEREAAVKREKAAKKRQVEKAVEEREEALAKTEELRERVLTAQERAAKRTRLAAEAEALDDKAEALGAARTAEVLEGALEAKRSQRKGA